ncbi:unnamed protein product [Amoebophrya sp. A25]|nr:unnamed protein product [Amoebophrya sp. A25]|eukprot:GSA25T00002735001.1
MNNFTSNLQKNREFTNFQAVRCELHCGKLILGIKELTQHYKYECPCRPLTCPNVCGWKGQAQHLEAHLAECIVDEPIRSLGSILTTVQAPFELQEKLSGIADLRRKLREQQLPKDASQELRRLTEQTQKTTQIEKDAAVLERRLSAIVKEKAEHVLQLLTTRCAADNLGDASKDRMEMCWRVWEQYDVCRKLDSDRDTLRPSEQVLLRFADFELATGVERQDVPRIGRAVDFIQKNYQYIPDDPQTSEQKNDTLLGLASILHEKKVLQLRQYKTYHKWFLDLCCQPYSKEMASRVCQCLEDCLVNPNLSDPHTRVTPLIAVCKRGYSDLVEEFLYVDTDAAAQALDGKSALHLVCERRDGKSLERFCATTKYKERNVSQLVNIRDKGGRTPLMLYCRHVVPGPEFLKDVQKVVESGCRGPLTPEDILGVRDKNRQTVLHHLLVNNVNCKDHKSLIEVILYLLENGLHATRVRDIHELNGILMVCKLRYPVTVIRAVLSTISTETEAEKAELLRGDDIGKNCIEWVRHWGTRGTEWRKWAAESEKLLMDAGHPKVWDVDVRRLGLRNNALEFADPKYQVIKTYDELRDEAIIASLQPLEASEVEEETPKDDPTSATAEEATATSAEEKNGAGGSEGAQPGGAGGAGDKVENKTSSDNTNTGDIRASATEDGATTAGATESEDVKGAKSKAAKGKRRGSVTGKDSPGPKKKGDTKKKGKKGDKDVEEEEDVADQPQYAQEPEEDEIVVWL